MDATTEARPPVEQFLYHEAFLIDHRRFQEWLDLLTEDMVYLIPNMREEGDPGIDAVIVNESYSDLKVRVARLLHPLNPTQMPPPRTTHFITNVALREAGEREFLVTSNLLVYVAQHGRVTHFPGSCEHRLRWVDSRWRICCKKVHLITNDQPLSQLPLL